MVDLKKQVGLVRAVLPGIIELVEKYKHQERIDIETKSIENLSVEEKCALLSRTNYKSRAWQRLISELESICDEGE